MSGKKKKKNPTEKEESDDIFDRKPKELDSFDDDIDLVSELLKKGSGVFIEEYTDDDKKDNKGSTQEYNSSHTDDPDLQRAISASMQSQSNTYSSYSEEDDLNRALHESMRQFYGPTTTTTTTTTTAYNEEDELRRALLQSLSPTERILEYIQEPGANITFLIDKSEKFMAGDFDNSSTKGFAEFAVFLENIECFDTSMFFRRDENKYIWAENGRANMDQLLTQIYSAALDKANDPEKGSRKKLKM